MIKGPGNDQRERDGELCCLKPCLPLILGGEKAAIQGEFGPNNVLNANQVDENGEVKICSCWSHIDRLGGLWIPFYCIQNFSCL